MKKVYVVPHMNIEHAIPACVLATSASFEESKDPFAVASENGWTIQLCPFCQERCREKQKRFNEWCEAVAHYAKNNINYTFHTASDMFDRCPYGYKGLCAQHEQQKQRG